MENESSQRAKLPPGPWKLSNTGKHPPPTRRATPRRFHSLAVKYGPLFHLNARTSRLHRRLLAGICRASFLGTHTDNSWLCRPLTSWRSRRIGYDSSGIGFSPYGALLGSCARSAAGASKQRFLSAVVAEGGRSVSIAELSDLHDGWVVTEMRRIRREMKTAFWMR
ncbi:hypothetical protein AXF42_Ash007881 [Apostasia shenzhenica]|uniref:Uncharacterized protein n=1 Tax=Apostasia shenzhenica TaxID=1088818 RepID=A0A2I0B5M6_9ASPA|nr:hypothetical protein AXF42_Ash007881 [Apostasia shenzhenica]